MDLTVKLTLVLHEKASFFRYIRPLRENTTKHGIQGTT